MESGDAIEVATVGNEGMVSSTAFLGIVDSPHRIIVQVQGHALRMDAKLLATECSSESPFKNLLIKYHMAFMTQVSQSVACNGLHSIHQRCCRWLLITHDRVEGMEFYLTHEYLAMMLGVRRASVSLVLHPLQERKLIRSGRGKITVLDRKGLEIAACECYQIVRDEFARIGLA
jgi:CRP-like cAMP-binding protein